MDAIANAERGEQALELGGRTFILLPTMEAAVAIEQQIGSLLALVRRVVSDGEPLGIREMSVIVCEGIRAKARELNSVDQHSSVDNVRRLIYQKGLVHPDLLNAISLYLVALVTGGTPPKGEPAGN